MEILGVAFGLSMAVFTVMIVLLSLALPVLWVWMLIDSIAREEWEYPGGTPTSNNRLVWALLIAFLQFPAVLYFFMVYGKVKRGTLARPTWAYPTIPAAPAA